MMRRRKVATSTNKTRRQPAVVSAHTDSIIRRASIVSSAHISTRRKARDDSRIPTRRPPTRMNGFQLRPYIRCSWLWKMKYSIAVQLQYAMRMSDIKILIYTNNNRSMCRFIEIANRFAFSSYTRHHNNRNYVRHRRVNNISMLIEEADDRRRPSTRCQSVMHLRQNRDGD